MKKTIIIFFLCFFAINTLFSQVNLVPNSSYEIMDSCPLYSMQIYLATHWFRPTTGTPDFFNSCSYPSIVGVPTNIQGHQYARTGNGYVGFLTYYGGSSQREYVEVQLDSVLKNQHRYCVELYVSLADTMDAACNNFGAYFSDTLLFSHNQNPLSVMPQITNDIVTNPLTSKTLWTKISGNFIATGGEQFLTIGNFVNDANSDTVVVGSGINLGSYYYLDDISVVDCTGIGINEVSEYKMHFKLYPNPNNGNMVLEYKIADNETGIISIYDVTGKMIKSTEFNSTYSSLSIDAANLEAGVYYYEINVDGNKVKTDKLIIIK